MSTALHVRGKLSNAIACQMAKGDRTSVNMQRYRVQRRLRTTIPRLRRAEDTQLHARRIIQAVAAGAAT